MGSWTTKPINHTIFVVGDNKYGQLFLGHKRSIKELIDVVEDCNADIIGIASILDRNLELVDFKYKYSPLVQYSVESWLEQDCPSCKKNLSITKRGRSGKK